MKDQELWIFHFHVYAQITRQLINYLLTRQRNITVMRESVGTAYVRVPHLCKSFYTLYTIYDHAGLGR